MAMITTRDASYDDDLVTSLKESSEAAAYIKVKAVVDLDNPAALLVALRQVATAHGMAEVARRADMDDKTLLRAMSDNGNPTITTFHKVLHAMGLRLSVTVDTAQA